MTMKLQKHLLVLISLISATFSFGHSEGIRGDFVDTLIEPYIEIHGALVTDDLEVAQTFASELIKKIRVGPSRMGSPKLIKLEIGAHKIKKSKNLLIARKAFNDSSKALEHLVKEIGLKSDTKLYMLSCPMAFDGGGANWLQDSRVVSNPYLGDEMIDCGRVKEQVAGSRDQLNLITASVNKSNLAQPENESLEEQDWDYPTVCVVSDEPLIEGKYLEIIFGGKPIRLCCKGCKRDFLENPQQYITKLEKLRRSGSNLEEDHR